MTAPVTNEDDTTACSRSLSPGEHLLILAATALICAAILQAEPLQSANDRSRWATVWSLVERGTFQIDEIDSYARWSTIDKVRYRTVESQPWHFYSSKPPLLSVLVAGLYSVERWTLGYGLFNHTSLVTHLLLLIVNGLTFWFALRSLSRCLIMLNASLAVRMFVVTVAGFGSMLNPYLTTLNNHTPAAAAAMISITAAVEILATRRHRTAVTMNAALHGRTFILLGFFAALTCCFELPAALLGVLSFAMAVTFDRRLTLKYYVPAAALPLAAFFITNWMVTGSVRPFYATYGSATYIYEHNGIPSYWSNPHDLDANHETPLVYLFHCVLGHHGLLSLTPVLCLSIYGWFVTLRRGGDPARRCIILTGAALTAITLCFYLTRTQNYNYGGNSVGLRWMLWLSPFWWIAMVPALENRNNRRWKFCGITFLVISMVSVAWSLNRPWKPSWLYEHMEAAGWINYRTHPTPFDPPRTSVFTLPADGTEISMAWQNSDHARLIVSASGKRAPVGRRSSADQVLTIELEVAGQRTILQSPFKSSAIPDGEQSREHLRIKDFSKILRQILAVEIISSERHRNGQPIILPTPQKSWTGFTAAGTTWVPSKSDPTKAWRVERGAARVLVNEPLFGRCWHRCDVMYCDQVPFGVLQWKTTVTSDATGKVLSTQTWIAENL